MSLHAFKKAYALMQEANLAYREAIQRELPKGTGVCWYVGRNLQSGIVESVAWDRVWVRNDHTGKVVRLDPSRFV